MLIGGSTETEIRSQQHLQSPLCFASAGSRAFRSSGYSPHWFAKNPGATDDMPMICRATGAAML